MTTLTSIADQPIGSQPLVDTFGRLHDNLRISVTDRCNIRCFYCMPEEDVKYAPREEILSFEEIERFVRVAVSLGVTKIRVTGGEPLVRKDLPLLIAKLCAIPGVRDVALTTNGVLSGAARAGAVRRRIAAAECPSGHVGSRALPENYAP